jgi:hypothetical protein
MAQVEKLFLSGLLVSIVAALIYTPAYTFRIEERQPEPAPMAITPSLPYATSPAEPQFERLITEAFTALASKFQISGPLGSIQVGVGELKAYQLFSSTNGPVSIEVHQLGADSRVWVCVPHRGLADGSGPNPAAYLWYQYVKDAETGNFVPVAHSLLESTPYPEPDIPPTELYRLILSQRWSDFESYDFNEYLHPDDDPPHWSPILVDNDESARARYQQIHNLMQSLTTQNDAIRMIDEAVPSRRASLTARVSHHYWPPATLRGVVSNIQVSAGDLKRDHAVAYYDGSGDIPIGGLGESTDTSWPGQDVDMLVIPDADVHYLGSWVRSYRDFEMNVEIEQFALGPHSLYYPTKGDWVQITGRWVIDCGHGTPLTTIAARDSSYARLIPADLFRSCLLDKARGVPREDCDEYHTEIHPPELIVTSRLVGDRTEAYVTATGAWPGEPLTFAVFPPPRPSLNAVLRYKIKDLAGIENRYDRRDGAELELAPFPATNPNHVVGRLTSTVGDALWLGETGTVLMTSRRGLKCIVECWWEVPRTSVEFIVGTLDDTPAFNSIIYYRNAIFPGSNWSLTPVTPASRCSGFRSCLSTTIPHLPNGDYVFRPASPDWDFGGGLAGAVPKSLSLRGGFHTHTFPAMPRRLPPSLPEWPGFITPDSSVFPPEAALVYDELKRLTLTYNSASLLGVQGNALRYPERGTLLLHLKGWVRSESFPTPVIRPEDAFAETRFPAHPYVLTGAPTEGVSRARVAVLLLLHSRGRTVVADRKEYETDDHGFLNVGFRTGSHVEDITLIFEVIENPFNPWFRPIGETEHIRVYPGAIGNDGGPLTLPVLEPSVVVRSAPFNSATKGRAVKLTAQEAELLDEIKEKRASFAFSKMFASRTLPKMLPPKVNPVMSKNKKLPGELENNWILLKDPIKAKTLLGDKLPVPTKRPARGGLIHKLKK